MLGPLCIGLSVFRVDGADAADGAPNLWSVLDEAVCRSRRDKQRRIAVDDSKRLKGSNSSRSIHPLKHLERGVLAFAGGLDDVAIDDDDGLLRSIGVEPPTHAWLDSRTTLPVGQSADEIRVAASRLRRAAEKAGASCIMLRCEAIDTERFNELVARSGNKSSVNMAAAMRHVDTVWRSWPGAHPRVIVDRQGGRTHYLSELQLAFPGAFVRIVAESEAVSRYRLERDGSNLTLSFVRESEKRHLPVALASMLAKYVRELHMLRLNRFFVGHMPELKPTAGYVEDARRYLREIDPLVRNLGISRDRLVRSV